MTALNLHVEGTNAALRRGRDLALLSAPVMALARAMTSSVVTLMTSVAPSACSSPTRALLRTYQAQNTRSQPHSES